MTTKQNKELFEIHPKPWEVVPLSDTSRHYDAIIVDRTGYAVHLFMPLTGLKHHLDVLVRAINKDDDERR